MMAAGAAAGVLASTVAVSTAMERARYKAILFDAFVLFDPRSVVAIAEQLFPGKGTELCNVWRTRQFEYSWLRSLTNQYVDFWQITQESLAFAAMMNKLALSQENRDQLMQAFLEIKPYSDAASELKSFKNSGIKLGFLSNLTPRMIEANVKHSNLSGLFDYSLSTDAVKSYKPDPRAYQMGMDATKFRKEEIVFAAFGGWDAAGAKWFGYPTFWVNRWNVPSEQLGVSPDGIGSNLADLAKFVNA
jgi:2-haloacid dehalogenase